MDATEQKKDSALPAILGWGGLAVFTVLFAWIVINQLQSAEEWANRGTEAVALVKQFKPDGKPDTMEDCPRRRKRASTSASSPELHQKDGRSTGDVALQGGNNPAWRSGESTSRRRTLGHKVMRQPDSHTRARQGGGQLEGSLGDRTTLGARL
jgi:hypothetical protein